MTTPKALVLAGLGINCEEETAYAFEKAGAKAEIQHINDLIAKKNLRGYQILAFPGGFSYGDHLGAGLALSTKIKNSMYEKLLEFVNKDTLTIGICNGFQVLTHLGLVPEIGEKQQVALLTNQNPRYLARWVDLKVKNSSPWLYKVEKLSLPIAHGEGKFYAEEKIMIELEKQIALQYMKGEISEHFNLPHNPNGSLYDIAGITDKTGRILGMMPHPERAIDSLHLPHWTWLKEHNNLPDEGPGMIIFKNAVNYFK